MHACHRITRTRRPRPSEFSAPGLVSFDWAPPSLDAGVAAGTTIAYPVNDFYLTNPIARSSPTLLRCSAELLHGESFAEAAE